MSVSILSIFFFLTMFFVMTERAHGALPPVSDDMRVLSKDAIRTFVLQGSQSQLGSVGFVDVAGQKFTQAIRATSQSGAGQEWNVQIAANTEKPVKSGDVLLAQFWLRCVESMTGEAVSGFVFELNGGDYAKAAELRASAGAEWVEFLVPFQAKRDYAAGEAHVCFRLGYDRQTVDIGGVEIINYGKTVPLIDLPRTRSSYKGREADAAWRKAAEERIDKLRKADLQIRVTDESGKPVNGATVEVTLKRHAFGFGTAVDAKLLMGDSADSQKYRQIIESLFNQAVFENDMKWPAVADGVPPVVDKAVAWLAERNFTIRGHNLVWPSWRWLPKSLDQYKADPTELRKRTAEHITRTVTHFKGQLAQWDVVNEPFSEHDLMDVLGRNVMVDWFKLARAADPQCKLFVNDYGIFDSGLGKNAHQDDFFQTVQFLKDNGAPIDGIGIQSHFAADPPSPEALLKTLDRFATFGLPIESTEVSINFDDRQLQADYLRDYMTALFSHPQVEGITLWGFWAGRHWRPDAALYAQDWSQRPVGKAFADLLIKTWTTKTTAKTAATGQVDVRGFTGAYDVVVTLPGGREKRVTAYLPTAGARLDVVVDGEGTAK